jgi:hypothetical protein
MKHYILIKICEVGDFQGVIRAIGFVGTKTLIWSASILDCTCCGFD